MSPDNRTATTSSEMRVLDGVDGCMDNVSLTQQGRQKEKRSCRSMRRLPAAEAAPPNIPRPCPASVVDSPKKGEVSTPFGVP